MNDEELCKMFGTTIEEVEADARKYERGDLDDVAFGEPCSGRPQARMLTSSVKFYDFELAAIDKAAKKLGISRSAFIRQACDYRLVEFA